MSAAQRLPGDRAMFGMLHGKFAYRCPVCDACRSAEVDTPCSSYCRGVAKKNNEPARRRGAAGGDRRG